MSSQAPTSENPWTTFLAGRGAVTQGDRTANFGDAPAELLAARDGTIVADLSHNALLEISGDDATSFLHGQFTNDVEALIEGAAQWNGWCSAKGRLLATFLLVKVPNGYLMMLPAQIAPSITRRLGMFVLRAKVKIRDASAELVRLGFAGKAAAMIVARHWGHTPEPMRSLEKRGTRVVALDEVRFVIIAPVSDAQDAFDTLAEDATRAGADAWEWTSINAGIPTIVTETQEAFVPQMANFELLGGVSFKKGCYPGQEIVARTQYRGILKRRMALAHVLDGASLKPGQAVYSPSFADQAAGEIVNVWPAPGGGADLLVVAQVESLRQRNLHLESPDGPPIEIRSHPPIDPAQS
ncbi:MAG: folate-binding protein [Usitatibacter sp.]